MAFQKPRKPPGFADLKTILSQTKETENPLYQVLEELIERLTQLKLITVEDVQGAIPVLKSKPPLPHAPTHMPGGSDILPVSAASKLIGRGSTVAGPVEEITLGTGIAMSGTTLNATGGVTPGPHATTHVAAGSDPVNVTTLGGYPGGTTNFLRADSTFAAPTVVPTAHATTHTAPGFGAATDTLDVRTLAGFSGVTTQYLSGIGSFTNPYTSAPASSIPESAISDDSLLARNAGNEIITGTWTFSHTTPQLALKETGGVADGKYWRWIATGGVLYLQALDDTFTVASNALLFLRTGGNVSSLRLQTGGIARTLIDSAGTLDHRYGLTFSGRSTATISGDQTAWNPTGLGTVYVINATATAAWSIRGILAQADGYVVVIYNAGAVPNDIIITREDSAASPANRILTSSANRTIVAGGSAQLIYDGSISRWHFIGP